MSNREPGGPHLKLGSDTEERNKGWVKKKTGLQRGDTAPRQGKLLGFEDTSDGGRFHPANKPSEDYQRDFQGQGKKSLPRFVGARKSQNSASNSASSAEWG